jgi:hypothetical protein
MDPFVPKSVHTVEMGYVIKLMALVYVGVRRDGRESIVMQVSLY